MRSMLRVEINQIISGLVEKHLVHRVVSTKLRPLMRNRVWTVGESDLEDGDQAFNVSQLPPSQIKA